MSQRRFINPYASFDTALFQLLLVIDLSFFYVRHYLDLVGIHRRFCSPSQESIITLQLITVGTLYYTTRLLHSRSFNFLPFDKAEIIEKQNNNEGGDWWVREVSESFWEGFGR